MTTRPDGSGNCVRSAELSELTQPQLGDARGLGSQWLCPGLTLPHLGLKLTPEQDFRGMTVILPCGYTTCKKLFIGE
jgi:hypothetical protein